jgi:hypothetical protein
MLELRRVAQSVGTEHCDLCGAVVTPDHRHLLETATREMKCVCRPCSILFERANQRFRLVGDRRLVLDDFVLDDVMWEELRLPVDIAFFIRGADGVQAFYPSPMGATESLLPLDAWEALEEANPVLRTLEPDVEALLVNRSRGARQQWIVPLDECYALVGVMRTRWRGLTGGTEVWQALAEFFERLDGS